MASYTPPPLPTSPPPRPTELMGAMASAGRRLDGCHCKRHPKPFEVVQEGTSAGTGHRQRAGIPPQQSGMVYNLLSTSTRPSLYVIVIRLVQKAQHVMLGSACKLSWCVLAGRGCMLVLSFSVVARSHQLLAALQTPLFELYLKSRHDHRVSLLPKS